jgi:hypothetical protein
MSERITSEGESSEAFGLWIVFSMENGAVLAAVALADAAGRREAGGTGDAERAGFATLVFGAGLVGLAVRADFFLAAVGM